MFGHLLKYSEAYNESIPEILTDLVREIPKEELISTIVAINSRINPVNNSHLDDSRGTQVDCLRMLFLDNQNSLEDSNCIYFLEKYLRTPENYILFSRVTCLYALQEIFCCENFSLVTPHYTVDLREKILKFLLLMNTNILKFDQEYNSSGHQQLGSRFFEFFMFKEIPQNQYYHSLNQLNFFEKSYSFLKKLEGNLFLGNHFSIYLFNTFGLKSFADFFKFFVYTYFKSYDDTLKLNYINIEQDKLEFVRILDGFSARTNYNKIDSDNLKIFDFLDLKKSPLYKNKNRSNENMISYLVLDNRFLLEKIYSLFINDFWFDYLKPNAICSRADWGNFIGDVFFEPFIEEIFTECFKSNTRTIFMHTNDLKLNIDNRNKKEYADYYIREKNKIILAEAKSNFLPLINGYKTVNTLEDFDKIDLDKFYKDYGLYQLVKKTLKRFHEYKYLLKDREFNFANKVEIFPTLIVNDHIFSSGYASMAFKMKFEELLNEESLSIETDFHKIYPLTIINVADLQNIKMSLKYGKQNIFNIFRHYHSTSGQKAIKRTENTTLALLTIGNSVQKLINKEMMSDKSFKWLKI